METEAGKQAMQQREALMDARDQMNMFGGDFEDQIDTTSFEPGKGRMASMLEQAERRKKMMGQQQMMMGDDIFQQKFAIPLDDDGEIGEDEKDDRKLMF